MPDLGWVSVLPPVLAIVLAIWSRQVYLSLAAGIWLGWTIIEGWNPGAGAARAIDESVGVLADSGNAKVILFTLAVGSLIATVESSGGVRGFVLWLEQRRWVTDGRRAQILAFLIGAVIFIESNITVLVSGSVARPLFDRYRVSRERLAYIVDSTSAPVCILIPLNAWGAYILGILATLEVADPLGVFLASIPLNFYAIAAVLLVGATAFFGLTIGPMKKAEERTQGGKLLWDNATPMMDADVLTHGEPPIEARARNMVIPIVTMVLAMPVGMLITGGGDLREGSGSTSVLWAVLAGLIMSWIVLRAQKAYTMDELVRIALKGAGALVPLALVMLLAFAIGGVASALGTGPYIAGVVAGLLPPFVFLPLVFLVSGVTSFSTGTSWGTFAIMLPIAVPAAEAMGLPLAPFVAAALSGGIFGDHSSPISDTTIVSSMVAATDHIDHVRTQLPYALIGGAAAVVAFAVLGAGL